MPGLDTIVYKFGGFIEYNAQPGEVLHVEGINFKGDEGYGAIAFELNIDSARRATYTRNPYAPRKYAGEVDSAAFGRLVQLMSYIQLPLLQDGYADTNIVDVQTYTLEVRYNGGKTKRIRDYGGYGTDGLYSVYNQLFRMAAKLPEQH